MKGCDKNASDEEILDTWVNSGLLEEIGDVWKLAVAKTLNRFANYMERNPLSETSFPMSMVVFPIIRRICNDFITFPDNDEYESYESYEEWYTASVDNNLKMIELLDPEDITIKISDSIYLAIGLAQTLYGRKDREYFDAEAEACCIIAKQLSSYHKSRYGKIINGR